MNRLLLIFVLAIAGAGFAQEPRKPIQTYEFGKITCEELLANVDYFHIQLQNNPADIGVVVIDSPRIGQDRSPFYRLIIQKTFQRHDYAYDRLKFYRRRSAELGGSMWLMPPGTELPFADIELWPDPPLDLKRAFIWDTFEDDGVCQTFAPREYARLIKSNQELRGHIVVHAATRRAAMKTGTEWLKELIESFGVPKNRLRLFIGKPSKIWYSTDFWIVPRKRR